jgi:hypothetical protein
VITDKYGTGKDMEGKDQVLQNNVTRVEEDNE